MHSSKCSHNFQMAQFLSPNIHEQVLSCHVGAVQSLNRILHRGREFPIGAAELFKKHIAKAWIGFIDTHGIHELFNVMIHRCGYLAVDAATGAFRFGLVSFSSLSVSSLSSRSISSSFTTDSAIEVSFSSVSVSSARVS